MTTGTDVLVEGRSDRIAVEALAARLGYELSAAHISIVDVGGVTNFRAHLETFGPKGQNLRVAGLCDHAETDIVIRALEAARVGHAVTPRSMAALGFFVCEGDLEDELLKAVGVPATLAIIEACGALPRFRLTQRQLPYRTASLKTQVRHLMTQRKIEYAPHLVAAMDLKKVPEPLAALLRFVMR
jgi:hypothetical protein